MGVLCRIWGRESFDNAQNCYLDLRHRRVTTEDKTAQYPGDF